MPNYRRAYRADSYDFMVVSDHRSPIPTGEQATDSQAVVRGYDVEYRVEPAGSWTALLSGTARTQTEFTGEEGQSYRFRVRAVDNVGNAGAWLETAAVTTNAVTKYYALAGQRVAMRQGSAVYYLYGDHLGSTSLVTDAAGATLTETRYEPYGQAYWQWGATRTDFGFTGQRLDGFGLMDYNARYYSSTLGRFVSPDSIIPQPGNPMAWDRYSYVYSNPVRYTDPSGHMLDDGCNSSGCTGDPNAIIHIIYLGGFPAIPRPNAVNFAEKAENSYDPQGRLDPSAGVSLVNDLMEQVMVYKYSHDPNEIHAYLKYEENKDASIEITTLELWNKSNRHASVGSVLIYAYNNPCNLSGRPDYAYKVVTPRIGNHNSGLGVVSPNNRRDIPLTPSGDQNPTNLFAGNSSVTVAATFYLYFPQYDTKYLYTALTTSIAQ